MSFCWIFNFVGFFLEFPGPTKVAGCAKPWMPCFWSLGFAHDAARLSLPSPPAHWRDPRVAASDQMARVCLVSKWQLMGKMYCFNENGFLIVYSYCLFKPKK